METKFIRLDLKASDEGVIEGYGAVFGNMDAVGDVIENGAFSATMGARRVKMLWMHDPGQPIGVWDEMAEDDNGLRVKGRLALNTVKGREAHELVKMGAIDGLSIGYRTVDFDRRGDARHLKEVDLFEVSLVTIPANDRASITSVKNITTRDVERDLREAGYSRSQAKAIALKGVSGLREADESDKAEAVKAAVDAFVSTAREG